MKSSWGVALFAAALLYCGVGYSSVHIFPAGTSVAASRTPSHLHLVPDDPIEVQVTIENNTPEPLRGTYFAEHVPSAFDVETVEVSVDGFPVQDYIYEVSSDDIYAHTDCHRWIMEEPGRYEETDNPLQRLLGIVPQKEPTPDNDASANPAAEFE